LSQHGRLLVRDSAVEVAGSPVQEDVPTFHETTRDSGYHDSGNSPVVQEAQIQQETTPHEKKRRSKEPKTPLRERYEIRKSTRTALHYRHTKQARKPTHRLRLSLLPRSEHHISLTPLLQPGIMPRLLRSRQPRLRTTAEGPCTLLRRRWASPLT